MGKSFFFFFFALSPHFFRVFSFILVSSSFPFFSHILAGTIKDIVTRYAHQTGHYVSRRFGWDCHGLPVEYEIDQKLKITGRDMVLEMGVDKYNAECRSIVQRYTKEWEKTVSRLGRWIDFKNDYKTMDPAFMESVWWVFKTIYDKDLVYRGYKVMPYSTFCGTPLSNFEAGLNYKDVNDPAIVVSFPLIDDPEVSLLAWTTTPWTLPSNLALCVNESYTYVKIVDKTRNNRVFILLEKRLSQLFREVGKEGCTDETKAKLFDIIDRFPGSALVGKKYTPLFDYFSYKASDGAFRVISDNYVTEEGGTGIVHQAPAFGEDDYRACLAAGIIAKGEEIPCPVDANGYFTKEVHHFVGQQVKSADDGICLMLKQNGRLLMKELYFHSYPFCWRSDTPLIYKAVPSWFVKVESLRSQLLENNAQTYWVPSFVQEKRFQNWLSEARDWAISRNRFWGTPIPLWVSDDFSEILAIGSVEELEKYSGIKVDDLHKEYVDQIIIKSPKTGNILKRVDEVFDCWFESGKESFFVFF
jgi:isoleucyl-tRNA synthetase